MTTFVVTTSAFGSSKTQIWHPSSPLPLGHPFQWVLERTRTGLRIRDISRTDSEIQKKKWREIPEALLRTGADLDLDGKTPISLRIRQVTELPPAFEDRTGSDLTVYTCSGNWVLNSTLLDHSRRIFTGLAAQKKQFTLQREGANQYTLRHIGKEGSEPLTLQLADVSARALKPGETLQLTSHQLTGAALVSGSVRWCFGLCGVPTLPVRPENKIVDAQNQVFYKILCRTAIGLAAFIALSWVWPKAKVDTQEMIPPQFAKILLQQPKLKAASAPAGSNTLAPTEKVANNAALPKKVQDAAVVQAFRAKALSSAVNGLLKGGMSRLLAQSDFANASKANQEARKIFDSKSNDLRATAPETGVNANKSVQIAALGGSAGGAPGAVGYGKGEHAGVKNQGGSFVTMDTSGSSVDEGLTKDEVGEVIHRHLSEVRYCYESAMVRTPDVEGKLMVNFTIGGKGAVKSSDVKSSSLSDPRLDDCILRRLATWKFPQPRGGIDVAVTYPFIFKTLGR